MTGTKHERIRKTGKDMKNGKGSGKDMKNRKVYEKQERI
jgi:hypothetical protein